MAQNLKDDIHNLGRGRPTRSRSGSRAVPHRLNQREQILFENARKNGFLKLPASPVRANVINLFRLWCRAEGRPCVITNTKNGENATACIPGTDRP